MRSLLVLSAVALLLLLVPTSSAAKADDPGMFPWLPSVAAALWPVATEEPATMEVGSKVPPKKIVRSGEGSYHNLGTKVEVKNQHSFSTLYPSEDRLLPLGPFPPLDNIIGESDMERQLRKDYEKKRSNTEKTFRTINHIMTEVTDHQQLGLIPYLRSQLMSLVGTTSNIPVFAFIGLQNVGKSFVFNSLTGLGCAYSQSKVATKAPVHYVLRHSNGPERAQITQPGQLPSDIDWANVSSYLGNVFETMPDVSPDIIKVSIEANWVPADVDFIDVPGIVSVSHLASRATTVTAIVEDLSAQPNVVFVVINDITAHAETQSDTLPHLLRSLGVPSTRIINVLNKANLMDGQAMSVADSYNRIIEWAEVLLMDEVPFIVGPSKDPALVDTWDSLGGTPQEQAARWKDARTRGDGIVSTWISTKINPHALRTVGPEAAIPMERVGVANLMAHITGRINDNIFSNIDSFVQAWREQEAAPATGPQAVPEPIAFRDVRKVYTALATKFESTFKKVLSGNDGVHDDLARFGGLEFLETADESKARNEQCAKDLEWTVAFHGFSYLPIKNDWPGFHIRDTRVIGNIHERGSIIGIGAIGPLVDQRVMTLVSLWPDEDNQASIQRLFETNPHFATKLLAAPIAFKVSRQILKMNIPGQLQSLVADTQCMHRRMVRAALFIFFHDLPPQQVAAGEFLFQLPFFQDLVSRVVDRVHDTLSRRFLDTAKELTGAMLDMALSETLVKDDTRYITTRFKDISEADIEDAGDVLLTTISTAKSLNSSPNAANEGLEDIYERAQRAAKVHYSHRVARLVDMLKAVYEAVWTRAELSNSIQDAFREELIDSEANDQQLAAEVAAYSQLVIQQHTPEEEYNNFVRRSFAKVNSKLQLLKSTIKSYQPFGSIDFAGVNQEMLDDFHRAMDGARSPPSAPIDPPSTTITSSLPPHDTVPPTPPTPDVDASADPSASVDLL